jgi:hypothetical protein
MLKVVPSRECFHRDLPPDSPDATICSLEGTLCRACAESALHGKCPDCGSERVRQPTRPAEKRAKHSASTESVFKPEGWRAA